MLVINEKLKNTERFLANVNREKEKHERIMREEANIKRDLRHMSRERGKVERTGQKSKIGRFNVKFVSHLGRLGILRQTHADVPQEEIKSVVRKWKEEL